MKKILKEGYGNTHTSMYTQLALEDLFSTEIILKYKKKKLIKYKSQHTHWVQGRV